MESEKVRRCCSIALVDDDPVVHFIFERLISRRYPWVTFLCFSRASEAITLIKQNLLIADLIVLDIDMPQMDGWQFLSELGTFQSTQPVCMLSSSSDPRDIQRANAFSMVKDYLTKPLDFDNIERIIQLLNRNSG